MTEAKRLVALAKTEGWDGKIRLAAGNDPIGLKWADAVATQLTAAGMDVTKQTDEDTTGVVNRVLVRRDFDLATWAYGMLDESDNNYNQLVSTFASANPRYGYGNAEMDAAIDLLRTADTDANIVDTISNDAEVRRQEFRRAANDRFAGRRRTADTDAKRTEAY